MAHIMRLDVYNQLLATGLLPLFYHDDLDVAVDIVTACAAFVASPAAAHLFWRG